MPHRLRWSVFLLVGALCLGHADAGAAPAAGTWTALATAGAPPAADSHVAVWTGSAMLVWGSNGAGGAYSPATNTWTTITTIGAPRPRRGPTGVWTGSRMIIWGGGGTQYHNDGAAYDPATNTWAALPIAGAPSPREEHTAVWTGREMLVWGGLGVTTPGQAAVPLGDGAAYDPTTNTWRPIAGAGAPSPRWGQSAVWTGSAMLVWGGVGTHSGEHLNDGAAYDPTTNTWRPIAGAGAPSPRYLNSAVWAGSTMLIWGGTDGLRPLGDGAAYDPTTNTWTALPADGAPSARFLHTAVWTGSEMLVWGGLNASGSVSASAVLGDGAAYTPATGSWAALPAAGAPSPRSNQAAAWTGTAMLIWGGGGVVNGAATPLGDGARYTPPMTHDARHFPQTGYRIDNDTIWDYFNRRGGVPTFGYPTSRTFLFQGFTVQFFQRRIVQLAPNGEARLLNLLDPGLLPYTGFNFSTFPGVESNLVATAPNPTDQPAVLAWVRQHATDTFKGQPVNFDAAFQSTVSAQVAFPNGGDASLLPGIGLEMWGIPTSQPTMDAHNHDFIYLRFQRGIMMYDAACTCTQGVLLADYLKAILTGQNLPADLAQEAANSPFLDQYDPSAPHWVHNPSLLPNTDLTNAFTAE